MQRAGNSPRSREMHRERQVPRSGVHQLRITLKFEEPKSNWQVNLGNYPSAGQCWRIAEVWSSSPPAGRLILRVLKDLRAVVASYNLDALGKHSPARMWAGSWCPVLVEDLQRARGHAPPTDYKAKGGQQMPSAHKESKASFCRKDSSDRPQTLVQRRLGIRIQYSRIPTDLLELAVPHFKEDTPVFHPS